MKKILFDIHKSKVMIIGHQYSHLSVDDFLCLRRNPATEKKSVFVEHGIQDPVIIAEPIVNFLDEGAAYITNRMARGYTGRKKIFLE